MRIQCCRHGAADVSPDTCLVCVCPQSCHDEEEDEEEEVKSFEVGGRPPSGCFLFPIPHTC